MSDFEKQIRNRNDTRVVLERARVYIANPDTWLQGALAADRSGTPVDVKHPSACRFCAIGAIRRALTVDLAGQVDLFDWQVFVILQLREATLVTVNDTDGRLAVLALFDDWLERNPS